jgi:hypothetical protein
MKTLSGARGVQEVLGNLFMELTLPPAIIIERHDRTFSSVQTVLILRRAKISSAKIQPANAIVQSTTMLNQGTASLARISAGW